MATRYDGIGQVPLLTAIASGLTKTTKLTTGDEGKPVKISANETVALLAEDDDLHGVVDNIEIDNDYCSWRPWGQATFTYTGGAPSVGLVRLVGSATIGAVKIAAAAAGSPECLVYSVDTDAETVSVFLPMGFARG